MRYLNFIVLLISASLAGGCSVLQGGKLLAPESFGLTPVSPNIYVAAGTDEGTQIKLCNKIIYRFLTYFKENKNSRNKADLAMFSYYLKERNRYQRLLKKRLAQNESPTS